MARRLVVCLVASVALLGLARPSLGGTVSHVFTDRAALYGHVVYVWNVAAAPLPDAEHDWTAAVGVGARFRLGNSHVYLVAEAAPQVGGLTNGADHVSIGVARRAGAHPGDWYVGFNVPRRFY